MADKDFAGINESRKNMLLRFLHHSMAMTGGFFACYAIMLRADFMGNAQTSNWIYLVLAILGRNPLEFITRLFGVFLYLLAAILYVVIIRKTHLNIRWLSIMTDIFAIVILALIPEDFDPVISLYPIFFAMSFQWNAFPGSYGYQSSTIFSTNNTRQVGLSIGEYICSKDKKHLHKTVFFLGSIAGFHIGVAFAYMAVCAFGVSAVWFNLINLLIAAVFLVLEEKEEKRVKSLLHLN